MSEISKSNSAPGEAKAPAKKRTKYPLLSVINSPADLRKLPVEALPKVCEELRGFMIENLSHNPGHFASSMGAVEEIVALHYVFDTPDDRIVFDVGHQAYAHKILTGRRDAFATQRTRGGISGFPTPSESEYDTFSAGHAGNSISAALGMAVADRLTPGHENRRTVALIGDASIGNGLAFEGLNNVSNNPNNLLIILNDNKMSIDDNVGALHRYLSRLTTSEGYNKMRFNLYKFFKARGMINDKGKGRMIRFNNSLKALIAKQQNIFEGLNIRYFGPFDGHDVTALVKTLGEIKEMKGPRLLHLHTVKGKGYEVAEKDPTTWHAPGKFNPETGERSKSTATRPKWQEVFGETLVQLAGEHEEITGITAAMPSGTSMNKMLARYPERTFDVGISEGHAVTFAGGLASSGKHPFVAIYSSFLQRAYDNIIHDVALQHLPVTLCIDRAGLVGEDGVTHHGLFDLAYLNVIPGMTIASPADTNTLRSLMLTSLGIPGPTAIRYPRGSVRDDDYVAGSEIRPIEIGKGRQVLKHDNAQVAILTLGPIMHEALKAAEILREQGKNVDIYDMIWLKPLDTQLLKEIASTHGLVVTVEDGVKTGGFGETVTEYISEQALDTHVKILGVPDRWIAHATPAQQYAECGIDAESIAQCISGSTKSE